MTLYYWTSPDGTHTLAMALAHNSEDARDLIEQASGQRPDYLKYPPERIELDRENPLPIALIHYGKTGEIRTLPN